MKVTRTPDDLSPEDRRLFDALKGGFRMFADDHSAAEGAPVIAGAAAQPHAETETGPQLSLCRRCHQQPADGSGIMCVQCWIDIGPYDRPIDTELCDE